MFLEIFLAIIQAATEFLPISSSGHLALFSNLLGEPNLSFFTALHLASLIAVLIFTRKEIKFLLTFNKEARKYWTYLIIATIPAALIGFFFHDLIESFFSSFLILGISFIFTGFILLSTKGIKSTSNLNFKSSLLIGLFQSIALFPGVSRSGMTISAGIFSKLDKESAAKFSFLLFIPLSVGAFILEFEKIALNLSLIISFLLCLFFSILFLNLLVKIIQKDKFWMFSSYCFIIGLISLLIYFFN